MKNYISQLSSFCFDAELTTFRGIFKSTNVSEFCTSHCLQNWTRTFIQGFEVTQVWRPFMSQIDVLKIAQHQSCVACARWECTESFWNVQTLFTQYFSAQKNTTSTINIFGTLLLFWIDEHERSFFCCTNSCPHLDRFGILTIWNHVRLAWKSCGPNSIILTMKQLFQWE